MKKQISTLILALCLGQLHAQSVTELMSQNKKYAEICERMQRKFQGRTFNKKQGNYSREYKQFKRWEYFWKYRHMSNGNFPSPNLIYDAWRASKDRGTTFSMYGNGSSGWEYFGPKDLPDSDIDYYPGLGRINTIAIHPTNHKILIAGGAGSGIWKTTDKGKTWTPKTDTMPNVGISSIIFDPNNSNIIYAATGDADGGRTPYSTGLFKSMDLGETWTIVGLNQDPTAGFSIRRIAMPTAPENSLIVTTSQGIQKSIDGGINFTRVSDTNGFCIFKAANSDSNYYVGTSDGRILKSTDGGDKWLDISPDTIKLSGRVELGITPANANFIIAIDSKGIVIKSVDGGSNWTKVTSPPFYSSQGGYNMTVAISPNDTNLIILGGVDGWRSTNGGSTWEKYLDGYWTKGNPYFYVHSDHHAMVFMPGGSDTLFVANDGGVFYGDIRQNNPFIDISNGLYTTQYYGIGALRTDEKVIIGGAQDNDGTYINDDIIKGVLQGSDGFDGMIDYSNPNISYASVAGGSTEKTTDGWNSTQPLTIPGYETDWEVPMAMHPTNPSIIFLAGNKLMKSADAGKSWTAIYEKPNEYAGIIEMAIAPSNGDIIVFASSYFGLKRTTDGGKNWTDISISSNLKLENLITGIAIHSANPDTMYISCSGFSQSEKVFKTVDAGQSWQNISYNLPNLPTNDIAYAAGTNDDLYLATDLGVYFNSAGAKNWSLFNNNLPYTQVTELEFHYGSNTIFAATFGRGIWKSQMANKIVTATSDLQENAGIKIFPTLNNGTFSIEVKKYYDTDTYDVLIFNSIGGVVYHKEYTGLKQQVDLSNVVNGVYFVSVRKENQIFTEKIIINAK